jgi:hypothetical protein
VHVEKDMKVVGHMMSERLPGSAGLSGSV